MVSNNKIIAEIERLKAYHHDRAAWKKWGPYLSERAWGTVREDYSPDGRTWSYFSHEMSRSRAYRWNEDGIGGISDRNQKLCFAWAFWNGKDPILKERMFGLSGEEGNHGEDVKEHWYYLDSTPTHSYMKMLYKYPQQAFPYEQLLKENQKRSPKDPEYELIDTGVFDKNRYFDLLIEYAKHAEEDLLIRLTVTNLGKEEASCSLLPTIWFRNDWSWGYPLGPMGERTTKPFLRHASGNAQESVIECFPSQETPYTLYAEGSPLLLFTENETNHQALFGAPNATPYVKDAFHRYLIEGDVEAINPSQTGTKAAALYKVIIPGEGSVQIRLRLSAKPHKAPFEDFDPLFAQRIQEADAFYEAVQKENLSPELKKIQRSAFAGLLWSKQFYYFDVEQWLEGDPNSPLERELPRNQHWEHLNAFDILSMPDTWEYPYFCSWDTAFHCLPFSMIDPDFAKRQLELMTREWYIHPNGQLPAYEWNFSDVNPPVLAWSAWRTYKIDGKITGNPDKNFIKGIFNKLLLNFTWWVNRKDTEGNNIFQGGFLGLDNISIFDRSAPLPTGGHIDQSDGTSWMAFFCMVMLRISLSLALEEPFYQDIATKFFEHFLRISCAMNRCGGGKGEALWNEEDGFFYDGLHLPDGSYTPIKVRSLVGLLPLLAVETLEPEMMQQLKIFNRRVDWFVKKHPKAVFNVACVYQPGLGKRRLLSILTEERLRSILKYLFDENEFLSPYGIRSLSKYHEKHPYTYFFGGQEYKVAYLPAESDSRLFGGNSNWRGPIWVPINFLLIESLQKYHHYYGDQFQIEFPTGSGKKKNLWDISLDLSHRLTRLFTPDPNHRRPIYGTDNRIQEDPQFRDLLLFHEYYHGDTGQGLGASHQTGWTALVAKLIQQAGESFYG